MSKIKENIKQYLNKKTKFGIASDVLFILLIIALAIPTTRTGLIVGIKKLTLFQPGIEKNIVQMSEEDYDWAIQNLEGDIVPFSSFKGKVVFLNTWATWCPHCIAEFPSIQRLYDNYGDKIEFAIISNEKPAVVRAFMDKEGYSFPVYLTYGGISEVFDSRTLPTTFLISQQGEFLINKKGSARWDGDKVKALIDDLLSK